jgi:prepilin-type N-terminal cleavage/methylation domain-containing protein
MRMLPCFQRRREHGFTLVEMVVTLMIFVLLAAAIFGIITGVLQSAGGLQDNQNRTDEVMALQSFLEKKLKEIPASGVFSSYRRGTGDGLDQNGIIFGTQNLLTAIDAKIQANGLYTLRCATFSSGGQDANAFQTFERSVTGDDSSLRWRTMVQDIHGLGWRFQDFQSTQWVTLWENFANRPNLVEFSLQPAGDSHPTVMDFWMPSITPTILNLPVNSGTSGTNNAPVSNGP